MSKTLSLSVNETIENSLWDQNSIQKLLFQETGNSEVVRLDKNPVFGRPFLGMAKTRLKIGLENQVTRYLKTKSRSY